MALMLVTYIVYVIMSLFFQATDKNRDLIQKFYDTFFMNSLFDTNVTSALQMGQKVDTYFVFNKNFCKNLSSLL